jgi:hypothetical protein
VLAVAARDPNNGNVGFPAEQNVVIPANDTYTYSKTKFFSGPVGTYRFFLTSFRNNVWDDNYPSSASGVTRTASAFLYDNPLITSSLSITPVNPTLQQPVTASFTIRNNSASAVTIPAVGVAARDPNGANVGFASDVNLTIPANSTHTYSKSRTFTGPVGTHRFFVTGLRSNGVWDDFYPANGPGLTRSANVFVYDNPLITTNLAISPANPARGQTVTASFTIRNNSSSPITIPVLAVAARDPNGNNVGFPAVQNAVVPANDTYVYSQSRTFTGNAGVYKLFVTSFHNNTWDDFYPANGPGLVRSLNVSIP